MSAPKILLIDVETAPNLGYVWGMWEQNVIDIQKSWYMLSFAYKWLGDKRVQTRALPDYDGYAKHPEDDKALIKELWWLLDQADVSIAHNGDRFDFRKAHARFIFHGLKPPSPYQTVDTLKIARKHFKFDSNKLDDLGGYLGLGRKLPHTGKNLWLGCMRGDPKSWAMMRRYNAHDVELLEGAYLKMRAWSNSHPRLTNFTREHACPTCQSEQIVKWGFRYTPSGKNSVLSVVLAATISSTGRISGKKRRRE